MTPAQRRYLGREAAVGAAINGVLSLIFALLVFHGQPAIAPAALVSDAVPQSFMVTLMSLVVPAHLTRRRIAGGNVAPLIGRGAVPGTFWRTPVVVVGVTVIAWAAHRLLLPTVLTAPVPFAAMLAGKIIYGALLGAGMTGLSVRWALTAPAPRSA